MDTGTNSGEVTYRIFCGCHSISSSEWIPYVRSRVLGDEAITSRDDAVVCMDATVILLEPMIVKYRELMYPIAQHVP